MLELHHPLLEFDAFAQGENLSSYLFFIISLHRFPFQIFHSFFAYSVLVRAFLWVFIFLIMILLVSSLSIFQLQISFLVLRILHFLILILQAPITSVVFSCPLVIKIYTNYIKTFKNLYVGNPSNKKVLSKLILDLNISI